MLKLITANISPLQTEPVTVFATRQEAIAHICDHVLTRPEAFFWFLVLAVYARIVDPTDEHALEALARALWETKNTRDEQLLYDDYSGLIEREIESSIRWSFYWEEIVPTGRCWLGIGLVGVHVVWNTQTVVTGMLIAFAARKPRQSVSYSDRSSNPRPRSTLWTRSMPACPPQGDETSRYFLFKTCAASVRRKYLAALSEKRVCSGAKYMQGLDIIPSKELWRTLR